MSDDQNIPADQPTDDSQQSTEENVQFLTESQLQTPSDRVIRAGTNYQLQTETMETHHPHHVTHKKKWGEYLLEFLMLFLAVFLGFVAENVREHQVENVRERKYMRSMIADLTSDTLMLGKNIGLRKSRIIMIDSLVKILNSPERDNKGNDMYFFSRSVSPPTNIFPNDGTIQQLKSSGNLRLIRNPTIANSIMAYDQMMRNALFEMGDEVQIRAEYRQLASKLFRTPVFHEMIAADTVSRPINNPQLYSDDAALINEFIGGAQYFKRVHQAQLIRSEELLMQAKQLISDIKKEYGLENE